MKRLKIILLIISLCAMMTILFSIINRKSPDQLERSRESESERTSGVMRALDFWAAQRAYPGRIIPPDKYYAEFTRAKAQLKKSADFPEFPGEWKCIGPKNCGGRTNALVFNPQNPNTIYAGSASGGLWRSYTMGVGRDAWHYAPTGYPVLGVNAIAFDPADTTVMYIGTGEVYAYQNATGGLYDRLTRGSYGIGILKTEDGGKTWSKSLDWSYQQQRGIQKLVINPQNTSVIYAATTEGTYKSTDAGASWHKIHDVIMAMDLVINPHDTGTVFVSCGNFGSDGLGIYRTKDGGASWMKLANGLPTRWTGKTLLAICDDYPDMIYADVANINNTLGLYLSADAGETWQVASTDDWAQYQGWYSHFVGVSPKSNANVIVGGIDLWKSTAAGVNLKQKTHWYLWYFDNVEPGGIEGPPNYSHADHHCIAYHPTNPDTIYFGTDGGVFRTLDGGETFQALNGGYATTQFYNGFSSSFSDSLLAMGGLQDNATVIYEGSDAWRKVIGGDGIVTAIHPDNPNILFGSYYNLAILKSTNRGRNNSWSRTTSGIDSGDPTNFAAPYILCYSDPQVLYAGTHKVYKTTNSAGYWVATNSGQPLNGDPVLSLAASFQNTDVVYAATTPVSQPAGIFTTQDGGNTWLDITHELPDRYPVDLAVDPQDDQIVYIAFSGFGTSHVFRSDDGGGSWQDIGAGLPDVPTSAIIVDPIYPAHIYVGNDIGVYVSTNSGVNWAEFFGNMPTAIIMDLSISPSNRVLRAATHGNAAFERKLLGPECTQIADQPQVVNAFELLQNHPNPFNASTTIPFRLARNGRMKLSILNALGQEIQVLVDDVRPEGLHSVVWEATGVASGNYFYRVQFGEQLETRKCVLVK
ncbi:T9SS type A sorting domain-containing protein [candidate division KSB1 bacterium]|nr:T9SS type A sorting domain-containing protein [candidate division KSB1 bacterium]